MKKFLSILLTLFIATTLIACDDIQRGIESGMGSDNGVEESPKFDLIDGKSVVEWWEDKIESVYNALSENDGYLSYLLLIEEKESIAVRINQPEKWSFTTAYEGLYNTLKTPLEHCRENGNRSDTCSTARAIAANLVYETFLSR